MNWDFVAQHMLQVQKLSVESDMMVDRRVVVKLLVTFFEKGQTGEIMNLMARMLGFSEEDRRKV